MFSLPNYHRVVSNTISVRMDSYVVFTRDKEMTRKYKKSIKYAFSQWVHVNSNKSKKCPNNDFRTPQCMGTTHKVLKADYNNAEMRY